MMRGVGGWRVRSVEWKGGTWYGIDGDVVGDGRHGVLVLVFGFARYSLRLRPILAASAHETQFFFLNFFLSQK